MKRIKFTKNQREIIFNKTNGHCAYCGTGIILKSMQVDHLKSLFKDGTNDINNLLPSCRPCNRRKGTFDIEQFRLEIQNQVSVLNKKYATYRNALRFGQIIENCEPIVFYFEKYRKR